MKSKVIEQLEIARAQGLSLAVLGEVDYEGCSLDIYTLVGPEGDNWYILFTKGEQIKVRVDEDTIFFNWRHLTSSDDPRKLFFIHPLKAAFNVTTKAV